MRVASEYGLNFISTFILAATAVFLGLLALLKFLNPSVEKLLGAVTIFINFFRDKMGYLRYLID